MRWALGRRAAPSVLVALASLLVVTGLAACSGDTGGGAPGSTSADGAEDDGTLVVEAMDKSFSGMPGQVEGGVVTIALRNRGNLTHEAFVLGIGDTPQDEALAAFEPVVAEEGAPIPDFVTAGGGVGDVAAGETGRTTLLLRPGSYLLVCTLDDGDSEPPEDGGGEEAEEASSPPHFTQGMVAPFAVTGGADAALPEADVTITAREASADAYTFDVAGVTAGEHEVLLANEGPDQLHDVALFEFPAGVDEAGARQAFEAFARAGPEGSPLPEGTPEPEEVGFSSVFSPGLGGTFAATFRPGRTYAAACFISDRSGGRPHAFGKGMVATFAVT